MKRLAGALLLCLTIAGLLLASCGGAQQTTTTTTTGTTTTTTVTTTTTAADRPQPGGQIVVAVATNWQDFDEVVGSPIVYNHPMRFTSQELWIGDWSTGPAGTNVNPTGDSRPMTFKTGDLAESWDLSQWDQGILTFKIRKDVHWALNERSEASRLVNGREVTADDVVYSFKQVCTTPSAYVYKAYTMLRTANITAPDRYTFQVKADTPTSLWFLRVTDFFHVVPHEVVEKYGNMKDWRNLVGSGPFMLTDWVDNSSVTFAKNATYWMKDTGIQGKGNQLPYVDTVKFLIIADTNTMQSAFRTGRIDTLSANWRDGPTYIKALPDAKYTQTQPASNLAGATVMRTDKAPFNDIRVRKALFKALDFPTISNAVTGPGSVYVNYPIGYSAPYKDAYLSLTDPDCPAEVKDVFTYDPAAAIQLLKDAGQYPLKGNIIVLNNTDVMDYFQLLQNYWSKVGVNVTIDPREQGAWYTIMQNRDYDFIMWGTFAPAPQLHQCTSMWGTTATNGSYVNDPVVNAARDKMLPLDVKDDPTADAMHRELMKYVLAQCWVIAPPAGPSYGLWWPWLKQFYGSRMGYGYINTDNWVIWAWVDQNLKRSMGH